MMLSKLGVVVMMVFIIVDVESDAVPEFVFLNVFFAVYRFCLFTCSFFRSFFCNFNTVHKYVILIKYFIIYDYISNY